LIEMTPCRSSIFPAAVGETVDFRMRKDCDQRRAPI
jgi:hypothetical protein